MGSPLVYLKSTPKPSPKRVRSRTPPQIAIPWARPWVSTFQVNSPAFQGCHCLNCQLQKQARRTPAALDGFPLKAQGLHPQNSTPRSKFAKETRRVWVLWPTLSPNRPHHTASKGPKKDMSRKVWAARWPIAQNVLPRNERLRLEQVQGLGWTCICNLHNLKA